MSTRQEKVQHLIIRDVCDILTKEFKDPRLGFVTVTDAEISPDMRYARVYVSVFGNEEEQNKNLKILKNAQAFFRQAIGKRLKMKVAPEIEFRLDSSAEHGIRIFELLEEVKKNETNKKSD